MQLSPFEVVGNPLRLVLPDQLLQLLLQLLLAVQLFRLEL